MAFEGISSDFVVEETSIKMRFSEVINSDLFLVLTVPTTTTEVRRWIFAQKTFFFLFRRRHKDGRASILMTIIAK